MTRLGGTIEVDSASGQGTTFRVTLPVARATASADPAPPVPQQLPPQARQGRVLVIDDEPLLLRAAERILAADRHVILASSAKEALALFERDEPFDVVLCDLMMPEMTGIALFERVAVRWPNLAERFVFLTGGVFSREAAAFLERCGRPCIDKPFQINTLVAIVNAVADAAPEPVPRP